MNRNKIISVIQVTILLICSFGVWQFSSQRDALEDRASAIEVEDSNGVVHKFDSHPQRVAITNTYAGTVMRMLEIDESVIVGVSGDFHDENLWPRLSEKTMIQQSAHSEIDFETLLDTRPDVYIVFATNGMVDTEPIRQMLEPLGIDVVALDFYKYDSLRYEINVLAAMFGKEDVAQEIFDEFDSIEAMVHQQLANISAEQRPRIVMEHHASLTRDPVVLTGTSQWTDLIERAGGVNVFANLPGHTTHVDMEAILDSNPDVIMFDGITFDIGYNAFDETDSCTTHMDFIITRPGFESLNAVQNNRMLIMSGEFAGPMMIHGLPTLAKLLHPDLFVDINAESYLDDYFVHHHDTERIGKFVCISEEG
ncbi:MAG: hypothetical protein CL967_00180 [Euryarchaeota archaeon]|nr:hypothetical protein [Euryarchaeota archaeon]